MREGYRKRDRRSEFLRPCCGMADEQLDCGSPNAEEDHMADKTLNVISICGSLRKGSYNRMVMNALPGLAPEGMQHQGSAAV